MVVGWGSLRFFFLFSFPTCPVGPTAPVAGAKGTVCFFSSFAALRRLISRSSTAVLASLVVLRRALPSLERDAV